MSVRNRCVIKAFGGLLYVVTLLFWIFLWVEGLLSQDWVRSLHFSLASVQMSLNSVQRLQRRFLIRIRQSGAKAEILVFQSVQRYTIDRWCCVHAFYQVLVHSVDLLQRGRLPCLSISEVIFFLISPKNTSLVEDVETLLPVKCRWIMFIVCRREIKKCQQIRGEGGHLDFPIRQFNTNVKEDIGIFISVKFPRIPVSGFWGKSKCEK